MQYPMKANELRDFYRVHTGKEPNDITSALLVAIVNALNQAYDDGVRDGERNS